MATALNKEDMLKEKAITEADNELEKLDQMHSKITELRNLLQIQKAVQLAKEFKFTALGVVGYDGRGIEVLNLPRITAANIRQFVTGELEDLANGLRREIEEAMNTEED